MYLYTEQQGNLKIKQERFKLTLEDILVFTTGASAVPPMGFDLTPKIIFHSTSPMPKANTCVPSLSLPLGTKEYECFKYRMAFGISNAFGFSDV